MTNHLVNVVVLYFLMSRPLYITSFSLSTASTCQFCKKPHHQHRHGTAVRIRARTTTPSNTKSCLSQNIPSEESSKYENAKQKRIKSALQVALQHLRPRKILPFFVAFAVGIRVGVSLQFQLLQSASSSAGTTTAVMASEASLNRATPVRNLARRFPIITLLLLIIAVRDMWLVTPPWIKRGFYVAASTTVGRWRQVTPPGVTTTAATSSADKIMPGMDDPNDLTSFAVLSTKLQTLYQSATAKLSTSSVANTTLLAPANLSASFLALLVLIGQIKEQRAETRDKLYMASSGTLIPKNNNKSTYSGPDEVLLQGLDQAFEFADWAYNEAPNGLNLRDNLQNANFTLLKHDDKITTAERGPGYVGHYIAISQQRKMVLIGVKGTSSLEDLLTDCCGNAVTYKLPNPVICYDDHNKSRNDHDDHSAHDHDETKMIETIRCHEGVLLSAERLANDLQPFMEDFVLPTDYDVLVTGHSLGAGVAALMTLILRSRIPALQQCNTQHRQERIRVLAFASPPILDHVAAIACASFITTIVNNSDVVPRASLSNILVLVEFLKFVNQRLEKNGLHLNTFKGTERFIKMLLRGNKGKMIISPGEFHDYLDQAFERVPVNDPDHLFVPGRVIQMYDMWSVTQQTDEAPLQGDQWNTTVIATQAAETATRVHITNGLSNVLRFIELDSRMMSDHMAPAYRSSIQSVLKQQ